MEEFLKKMCEELSQVTDWSAAYEITDEKKGLATIVFECYNESFFIEMMNTNILSVSKQAFAKEAGESIDTAIEWQTIIQIRNAHMSAVHWVAR